MDGMSLETSLKARPKTNRMLWALRVYRDLNDFTVHFIDLLLRLCYRRQAVKSAFYDNMINDCQATKKKRRHEENTPKENISDAPDGGENKEKGNVLRHNR